jgi:hypothetical protein
MVLDLNVEESVVRAEPTGVYHMILDYFDLDLFAT